MLILLNNQVYHFFFILFTIFSQFLFFYLIHFFIELIHQEIKSQGKALFVLDLETFLKFILILFKSKLIFIKFFSFNYFNFFIYLNIFLVSIINFIYLLLLLLLNHKSLFFQHFSNLGYHLNDAFLDGFI